MLVSNTSNHPTHGDHPFNMTFRMVVVSFILQILLLLLGVALNLTVQLSSIWEDEPPSSFLPISFCIAATGLVLCFRSYRALKKRWSVSSEVHLDQGLTFLYLNVAILVINLLIIIGFLASGSSICQKNLSECVVSQTCSSLNHANDDSSSIPCCERDSVGNGICDEYCNTTRFAFDEGDCLSCGAEGCDTGNRNLLSQQEDFLFLDSIALSKQKQRQDPEQVQSNNASSLLNNTSSEEAESSSNSTSSEEEGQSIILHRVYCEDLFDDSTVPLSMMKSKCCITKDYGSMCSALIGFSYGAISLSILLLLMNCKPLALLCCRESLTDPATVASVNQGPVRHDSTRHLRSVSIELESESEHPNSRNP